MLAVHCATVLLLCAVVGCANTRGQSCYSDEKEPYVLLSSKTAYELVHNDNATAVNYPGCKARQFWILSRHGTRYPNKKGIKKMLEDGPKLQASILNQTSLLCRADLDNLKAWQPPAITERDDEHLTTQGRIDLCFIARRFKQRHPHLLHVVYDKHLFKFRTTKSQRTKRSLTAFAECLFGTSDVKFPKPIAPDPLIETYEACPAWLETKDANKAEADKFTESSFVANVVRNVSERLGFGGKPLAYDDVDLMYDLCRYEKAWDPPLVSPWCAAFSPGDLQVFEYLEDLKYYYTEGYGSQLNVDIGCPPVKDFIDGFSAVEQGLPSPRGIFYFSHSTTINMVLSRLGLYKDEVPPTAANFPAMHSRQWRSSLRGTFASNIAAVLYECDDGEKWRVKVSVEERDVQLAGCPAEGLCSWRVVKEAFKDIQQCDDIVKEKCKI